MFLKKMQLAGYLIAFQLLAINGNSQNIDIDILKSINPQYPQSGYWKGVSKSYILVTGTATFGELAYGLLSQDEKVQKNALETFIEIGINIVVTTGMKAAFNRTRPSDKYPNDVFVLTTSNGQSFPSGHTSLAFATATSFAIQYKKWYVVVPAYLWAGSVGYSRMYLGKHYPTDVLAGAVVGAGSSVLSHWISKKIFKPKKQGS
ncbi:phosphatase PAP2 family protein [soil metagenome]